MTLESNVTSAPYLSQLSTDCSQLPHYRANRRKLYVLLVRKLAAKKRFSCQDGVLKMGVKSTPVKLKLELFLGIVLQFLWESVARLTSGVYYFYTIKKKKKKYWKEAIPWHTVRMYLYSAYLGQISHN